MAAASASASRPPALAVSQARVAASEGATPVRGCQGRPDQNRSAQVAGAPDRVAETAVRVPGPNQPSRSLGHPAASRVHPVSLPQMAVERALLDNSPSQWPCRTRESSSFRVGRAWQFAEVWTEFIVYRGSERLQIPACSFPVHLRF